MTLMNYKIVKRKVANIWLEIGAVILALVLSLLISAALIATSGANPLDAMKALYKGAFGNWNAVLETLVQATPLMFTGLAIVVAFRAKIFNIGAEGQFFAGAMAATWINLNLSHLPNPVIIALVIVTSLAAGALWGFIPGYLKARFNANVIIVTVMLNYVILLFLSFLLGSVWMDPAVFTLATIRFDPVTYFPTFFDSRLHLGLILALIMSVIVYVILWKTPLGYEIRAIGDNPTAAKYKGTNIKLMTILVMAISGAIAGLAGGSEIQGIHHRLLLDISTGYGFTGILIALLGRLHPFGVIPAAIFFGALVNGSVGMQIFTGVPVSLVYSVQGIVLMCLLAAEALTMYKLERLPNA
jgi:general nucleoside transport system permease protein